MGDRRIQCPKPLRLHILPLLLSLPNHAANLGKSITDLVTHLRLSRPGKYSALHDVIRKHQRNPRASSVRLAQAVHLHRVASIVLPCVVIFVAGTVWFIFLFVLLLLVWFFP
jgi:hypothetical protein